MEIKPGDTITVQGTPSGTKAVWMNFYDYALTSDRRDQLISPPLNFTGFSSVSLSFQHAYAERAALKDSLIVKLSDDCGTSWNRILAAVLMRPPTFLQHIPKQVLLFIRIHPETGAIQHTELHAMTWISQRGRDRPVSRFSLNPITGTGITCLSTMSVSQVLLELLTIRKN